MPTEELDLLIHADWIASVDANDTVHAQASLAVSGTEIVGIYPQALARAEMSAREVHDLPGHMLCPGFINAHGHAAMSLLRGFADDLPLMDWLQNHIWPAESQFVDPDFVRDGVELAIAEMLRSGTTCFSDMYFFPDVTATTAHGLGMRAHLAFPVLEAETAWAANRDEYLDKGLQLNDDFRHSSYVDVCFGPHAPYTVQRDTLERIAMLDNELELGVHMHLHETEQEVAQFVEQHGQRPLAMLDEVGLATPRLQCAHMVDCDADDTERLAASGAHVIHCARSNLKLASGFCPVDRLAGAGINVALGTDGAASNNRLDMLGEINLSAVLAKAVAASAEAQPAPQVLRNATINGARAIGRERDLGSLEVGKQADVIAVDLANCESWPMYEPVSHLVYSASSAHIEHVWIAGQHKLQNRNLQGLQVEQLRDKASYWMEKINT